MAKTTYNWQNRGLDTQIDWASIGKDMSTMLSDQMKLREDKKAEIDKKSKEYLDELAAPPTGDFESGTTAALKLSDQSQQWSLMQDRLMKSGILNPRDFVINRENNYKETKQFFDLSKKFQDEYKRKLDRWKNDESMQMEGKAMELGEDFSRFKDMEVIIHPETGALSFAKLGPPNKDGIREPIDRYTMAQMNNLISVDYDRFGTSEWLNKQEEVVGAWKAISLAGADKDRQLRWIENISDKTKRDNGDGKAWNEQINDITKELFVNPLSAASVLTDTMSGYDSVFKESDALDENGKRDQTKVLFVNDGYGRWTPEITDEQKESLKDYVDRQMVIRVDKEVTASGISSKPQYQPNNAAIARGDKKRTKKQMGTLIGDLRHGTKEEIQAAADAFRGFEGSGIKRIDRTPTGVTLIFKDPEREDEPVSFGDSEENFVNKVWNFIVPEGFDSTKPIEDYILTGKAVTPKLIVNSFGQSKTVQDIDDAYRDKIINDAGFNINDDYDANSVINTAKGIESSMRRIPIMEDWSIEPTDYWMDDNEIIIKKGDGTEFRRYTFNKDFDFWDVVDDILSTGVSIADVKYKTSVSKPKTTGGAQTTDAPAEGDKIFEE